MANSKLTNKFYRIPDDVHNKIVNQLNKINFSEDEKGVKRAKDIINNKEISYGQMTRLKNYFDNYEGDMSDNEFKIIGGNITKKWVNNELFKDTESIRRIKKSKMDSGMENQFLSPHKKDNDNTNPTDPKGGLIDIKKSSKLRNIMANDAIYKTSESKTYNEEIKNIKYLIEYLNR